MNTALLTEFRSTLRDEECAAAREEILLATLKSLKTLAIGDMANLIINEALSDHAQFLPEVVTA